jgi:D-tyrosyl-tRNA(Tyr) deacylase
MRVLLQRVTSASVEVNGEIVGRIGRGLLVFLGVGRGDGDEDARKLADRVVGLRVFPDEVNAMNLSLRECGGEILLVSQFTLFAKTSRGRRPSFEGAENAARAEVLYRGFAAELENLGFKPQEGVFGARMRVRLENDGPVTLLLDSQGPSDESSRPA